MTKKSIKKNYFLNLSYEILALITPFITTPYVSRVLGADGVGEVSYATSIVTYFTLFATMGITAYGQREIAYVQDSVEQRSSVFWNTKLLEIITSSVALIVYIVFAIVTGKTAVFLVLSFNILAVAADVNWFFQGMEEFGKIVFRNFIFKAVNIIYVFLAIRSKNDVICYAFGTSFFLFFSNASLWVYLPRFVTIKKCADLRPFKDIRIILSLFVPAIAIQVYTVLDKTMIGIITRNSFENGYYEQSLKISRIVLTLVTALGTVMIPRIGYHYERKEKKNSQRPYIPCI